MAVAVSYMATLSGARGWSTRETSSGGRAASEPSVASEPCRGTAECLRAPVRGPALLQVSVRARNLVLRVSLGRNEPRHPRVCVRANREAEIFLLCGEKILCLCQHAEPTPVLDQFSCVSSFSEKMR